LKNKFHDKVYKLVEKWRCKMMLESWDIDVVISKDRTCYQGGAATCKSDPIYKNALITIYQSSFEKPNNLEHIIIHELAHCITEPLYLICFDLLNAKFRTHIEIENHREILTEHIAKMLRSK